MKFSSRALPLAAGLLLSACGGGGGSGGVNSTPTPTPTPTGTISQPQGSRSFTNDAAASQLSFDLSTSKAIAGSATNGQLTVAYDAASKNYTVTLGGRQDTFTTADVVSDAQGEVRYKRTVGGSPTYLTLVTTTYSRAMAQQYVGLGFLQRNTVSGGRQDTQFSVFTYGFDTPGASVPRTGKAAYAIDIFGLASFPGYEPTVLQGAGTFNTDFASGVFSAQGLLSEQGLVTGNGVFGGNIELVAGGRLAANDGTFAGNARFGTSHGEISGTLAGRFYGPQAQELGAQFNGNSAAGAMNGAFTGQRDANATPANLTLTNLTGAQAFYAPSVDLNLQNGGYGFQVRAYEMNGAVNYRGGETIAVGPGNSGFPSPEFTSADKVASSDPNFTAYRKTVDGKDILLELYKPGSANTQLVLTYASFARWSSSDASSVVNNRDRIFFAYGVETPGRLLLAKTGTARYTGVVIGAGANQTNGNTYDVSGTSRFDVDFSRQHYSGALALQGQGTNGTASTDFGSFGFDGALSSYVVETLVGLKNAVGDSVGQMRTRFYGPDGEEIAGTFNLITSIKGGGTTIAGATAAKRQ